MPTKNRNASQARKDRAALKRLQKSGKYKGKIDARKQPTRRQRELIKELTRAKAKRSKSKQPLPPKPRIPKGAKLKRSRMTRKELDAVKPTGNKLTTYALPFNRRGQLEPEWRRFTRSGLTRFLSEYKAGDEEGAAEWREYAVREQWIFETKPEKSDFRHDIELYFTGVRIDAPHGTIKKRRVKKAPGHSKPGTKRAARRRGKK